jgi:outer membrane protein TolC
MKWVQKTLLARMLPMRASCGAMCTVLSLVIGAAPLVSQEPGATSLNVRLGPFENSSAARAAMDALLVEAIDCFMFPPAEDGTVEVSVGVFQVPDNANQMAERVEALELGPVRIVNLAPQRNSARGESVPLEDAAAAVTEAVEQPIVEALLYGGRYGWFADHQTALETHQQLTSAGFEPRLLVFQPSGQATLGLGVFTTRNDAQRQIALLEADGFADGRIYPVDREEVADRQLSPATRASGVAAPLPPADSELSTPEVAGAAAQTSADERSVAVPFSEPDPGPTTSATDRVVAVTERGGSTPGSTSTPAPYRLSLSEAVLYALDNSPELQNQALEVELSETDLRRARGLVQPKIAFQHQSTRIDTDTFEYYNQLPNGANLLLEQLGLPPTVPPFVFEESHHTQVLLTQNLFAGGGNRFRISGARAHRDATRSRLDDQRVETVTLVRQAFFDLTRQWEVVGLRRESLARAERSLESVQRRFSLGLVPRADVLQWQVQVSGERVLLIQAQNLYEVGLERFKRLIGYPPASPLQLVFLSDHEVERIMAEGTAALDHDRSTHDDSWLEDHPAVRAARRDAEAARLQRRAANSDFWPALDFDGAVGYLENDTLDLDEFMEWSARLRLTFSLWDGGVRVQNRAEARTKEDLADLQLRVIRDELFIQDRSLVADLRADLAALEEARAAVAQARETMESVTNKAALGLADYIQRIDAQVILTQSEVAETSARYQFIIDLFRWWRVRDPDRLLAGFSS